MIENAKIVSFRQVLEKEGINAGMLVTGWSNELSPTFNADKPIA